MRILVTGGAGYIGSHAVRHLLRSGHEVVVYDNLSAGHKKSVPFGALVVGDLTDRVRLSQTMRDESIEAVMHFAAHAYVGESVENPGKYWGNNVVGSWHLLEAMREADIKKIVFSSTTATYGEPDTIPIPETTPQRPINPYGMTKLVIEQMLDDYAKGVWVFLCGVKVFQCRWRECRWRPGRRSHAGNAFDSVDPTNRFASA